jgi:phage terminase small subunit
LNRQKKMPDLTPKQAMFCKEYIIDLNGTQAAIRAGYSQKTARQIADQLLSKLDIQQYVQSLMDKRVERTEITADYVLNGIKETIEKCSQAVKAADGDYKFDSGAVLKGYELLGKHLKLFTDKTEHTGKDGGAIDHSVTVKYAD